MQGTKLAFILLLATTTLAADYFIFHPGVAIKKKTLRELRNSELAKLNAYRQEHQVGTLQLNGKLNTAAQAYADNLCKTLTFDHSPQATAGQYGENLYMAKAYPFIQYYNGTATKDWQDERDHYDYNSGTTTDPSKMIGHFTAQMWKTVKRVGFGFCTTTQKYNHPTAGVLTLAVLYVVANYSPTPNIIGQFTQNVFRPV